MNFAKLLAAGKSIINSGGSVTYKENKGVYLPKFESPKNPFGKIAPANDPVVSPAAVPNPALGKVPAGPLKIARSTVWATKLNPAGIFRSPSAPPLRSGKAEQTELSLDTVKVVGSDLSDTDVEVVPLKSRRPRSKAGTPQAEEWDEVGAEVFGVNLV